MSFTDLGVILTFLIGICNIIYSLYNNKKTQFINTVTSSRMKWISELRESLVSIVNLALMNEVNQVEYDLDKDIYNDIVEIRDSKCTNYYNINLIYKNFYKIKLLLNSEDAIDKEILKRIEIMIIYCKEYNYCCEICNYYIADNVKLMILKVIDEKIINYIFNKCILQKEFDEHKYTDKIEYIYNEFIIKAKLRAYIEFNNIIIECLNIFFPKLINDTIDELIKVCSIYLKDEWERVKKEAEVGKVDYKLEKSNGIELSKVKSIKELRNWKKYKRIKEESLIFKVLYIIILIITTSVIFYFLKKKIL